MNSVFTREAVPGMELFFSPKMNLSLDYSHYFRNVETDNETVQRLKEYSENRLSAVLSYKF